MIKEYLMQVTNSPSKQQHHHHLIQQQNPQHQTQHQQLFKQTNATQGWINRQFAEQTLDRKPTSKEKTEMIPVAPEKRVPNKEKIDPHPQNPDVTKPQMKASLIEQSASKKSMKNLHQASGQKSERNLKQPSSNLKPQQTTNRNIGGNSSSNFYGESSAQQTHHHQSSSNLKNSSPNHSTFGRPFESSAKKSMKQSQEFDKQSYYHGAKVHSAFESASDLKANNNQGHALLGESSRFVSETKANPHIPYGKP
jgi:hypothetical protein